MDYAEGKPEPRGDDSRHQSAAPAQEAARVRPGLLSRWRGPDARRALLSVSDKTGIVELARELIASGSS
jgi:hypothetical protein